MSMYQAPVEEITFVLETMGGMAEWTSLPGFEEAGEDLVAAVLEEAGKFASEIIAPTNKIGDETHPQLTEGNVKTPDAFKPMHQAFVEGGWSTLSADPEFDGQGLPTTLSAAVGEMQMSANMAYSLLSLLTTGAIEAISAHGSEDIRQKYLSKMVTTEWSGAMNLTEPGAGSDVGALRTKA
ncbi:MAG: acyl-CoA dehydrogenase family protein, partial [Kordiimonadaceae bacterium]|nr:acyl-CoA dehydrogenase family protein [Kordiimonadaceae bacterium]